MAFLADQRRAAAVSRPSFDLSRLIGPVQPQTFGQDYWERRPLHIPRGDPGYYAELLTLADVDRILSLSPVRDGDLRIVLDGKGTPISELGSQQQGPARINALEELYGRYREGATVVLNALENRWEPLKRLCRALGTEFSAKVQVNVYVTPAGNRGFKPHYDTHDVFIAQVHGTKNWQLYGSPIELPLRSQPHDKSLPEPAGPDLELQMRCGDLLYLPRGTVHAATANDTTSVHLTIGIHPVLWSEVISDAAAQVFAADARFRRSLPIGFARSTERRRQAETEFSEHVRILASSMSAPHTLAAMARRINSMQWPTLMGHLSDLDHLGGVRADTRVVRRTDLQWTLSCDGVAVDLEFHNKTVRLPAAVADEVRYVGESNGAGFTPAEIPGELDEPGRLVLIRALLREGFLTLA